MLLLGVPLSLPLICMTDEGTAARIRLVSDGAGNVELTFFLTPRDMFFFSSSPSCFSVTGFALKYVFSNTLFLF